MIAKLVNGNLVQCPKFGQDGSGRVHTNLPKYYEENLDGAAVDGYYPVVFVPKPEGDYASSWSLQTYDGRLSIVQVWTQSEPQPEPVSLESEVASLRERLLEQTVRNDMLEECILEMSEVVYA